MRAWHWVCGSVIGAAAAGVVLLLGAAPASAQSECDSLEGSLEDDEGLDLDEYGDDPSDLGHYDDVFALDECRAREQAEEDDRRRNRTIWWTVGSGAAGGAAVATRRRRRRHRSSLYEPEELELPHDAVPIRDLDDDKLR